MSFMDLSIRSKLYFTIQSEVQIKAELTEAGIPVVSGKLQYGDVPSRITGKLYRIEFERGHNYWYTRGRVPWEVAREISGNHALDNQIKLEYFGREVKPQELAFPDVNSACRSGIMEGCLERVSILQRAVQVELPIYVQDGTYNIFTQAALNEFVRIVKLHEA